MLVLLLALFISIFSVAALQPPTIFTIHPLFGAANELTSIQIHGQGFPSQRENIVDVGLIVTLPLGPQCNGQGADLLGNSTALAHTEAVRLSCLWSIFHLTETEIGCRLSALHGDYRVPSPLLADAPPMFSVREGFVYVITADDPSVIRFNTAVRFRFLPACHLHTNPTVCGAENCSWCDFGGRCLSSPADCTERCSTAHFRLSCAELYWTISLSVLIALVVPALVYFAITRQKMLREDITYRLLKASPTLMEGVSPSTSARCVEEEDGHWCYWDRTTAIEDSPMGTSESMAGREDGCIAEERHRRRYRSFLESERYRMEVERKHGLLKAPEKLTFFF